MKSGSDVLGGSIVATARTAGFGTSPASQFISALREVVKEETFRGPPHVRTLRDDTPAGA